MTQLACPECGAPMSSDGITWSTLVGYSSPLGHDHDDNCHFREYVCANGHSRKVSRVNRCHCGWHGRTECFCHPGPKVEEWPA